MSDPGAFLMAPEEREQAAASERIRYKKDERDMYLILTVITWEIK
jgi:hypothetical protein